MALRDSTIAVNWDVGGVSELNQSEDKIQDAADEAEELERDVESAGDEMEATGQKGQDAFMGIADAVDDISFGSLAAGGGVVAGSGAAALQTFATAAGDVESARTAIQAQAGGQAERLIQEARAYERWSNSAVSATDIMESQRMLLRSDALSGETVANLTDSLSNLAVAYNRDLRDVFEEVRDPLFEAEGATQLVTKGFIRNQEEIFKARGVWEDGIRTFRKFREEMGTTASRQLIVNELIRKGRREQNAAEAQLGTYNRRWEGLTNELDRTAAVMGGQLARNQSSLIGQFTEWLRVTRETDRGTLAMTTSIIKLASGGASAVAVFGVLGKAISGFAGLMGTTTVLTTGAVALLTALAGVIAFDIVSALITGESFFIEWGETLEWWLGVWRDVQDALSGDTEAGEQLPDEMRNTSTDDVSSAGAAGGASFFAGSPGAAISPDFFNRLFSGGEDFQITGFTPFGTPQFSPAASGGGSGSKPQAVGQFVPVRVTNQGAQVRRVEVDIRADGDTADEREAGRKAAEAMKKELERERSVQVEGAK